MVRINQHQLSQKEAQRLLKEFDTILAKLPKNEIGTFFNELLGKEERLMLAKRIAAVVLLSEGYSEYKTALVLKLSPTTTGKIADGIACGTYAKTLALLRKNKKDYFAILETIDSILHLGGLLPHRYGLERYRGIK